MHCGQFLVKGFSTLNSKTAKYWSKINPLKQKVETFIF